MECDSSECSGTVCLPSQTKVLNFYWIQIGFSYFTKLNFSLHLNKPVLLVVSLVVCLAKQCQRVTVKQFMNIKGNNIILAQWLGKYPCVCRRIRVRLENNGFFIQPKYPLIPLARELQKKNDTLCPLSESAPALAISQPTQTIIHKNSLYY